MDHDTYTPNEFYKKRKGQKFGPHLNETKSKISEANKGSSKAPRPILTPNGNFESLSAAALAFGITPAGVLRKLKAGKPGWEYINDKPKLADKIVRKNKLVPIRDINGTVWPSMAVAAEAHGIYTWKLQSMIDKGEGGFTRLYPIREVTVGVHIRRVKDPNGVVWPSTASAARSLGIYPDKLKYSINHSNQFPGWSWYNE